MTRNAEVADRLDEIADRLDAQDVEFKPRAYRRAADRIRELDRPVEEVADEGLEALEALEGVGEAIAAKIVEYLEEDRIEELQDLREALPVDMSALTRVEGLGPKRVGALYRALEITDLDELEAAAEAGRIQGVDGFGATTEANILERLPFARAAAERHLLVHGVAVAESLLDDLEACAAVERASVAGSIRRWLPTVGDVDLLVATTDPASVLAAIEASDAVDEVRQSGERKARIRSPEGVSADFRFIEPADFGAALQYFTGSKDHNVQVRRRAIDRGLKVNEYGVFRGEDRIAGETEASVYEAVDLPLFEPELREARGEIEAADANALPDLVERDDLRGDLHLHTRWSDGVLEVEELAAAAEAAGHEYLAITDHAPGGGVRGDIALPVDAFEEQAAAVEAARSGTDLTLFHGVEANIEADGSIDLPDALLDGLDLVVASPHAALRQDREAATERLVAAVGHPHVDIIGHPTGRKLGQRPGLGPDMAAVVEAAADAGTALEVNSHPARLDLDGQAVRRAVEAGVPVAISTDAHRAEELELLRFGVHTARRGWAEAADILNTRSAVDLADWLG